MTETEFDTPTGVVTLRRIPHDERSPLRAWDAADDYVLTHLAEVESLATAPGQLLIVNDSFGGLTVPLAGHRPIVWVDSVRTERAIRENLQRNDVDPTSARLLASTETPTAPIGAVVIKVPKSNAMLEHQLRTIRPLLTAEATIVGAGMVKHLPRSAIELFDAIIGPTTTSRAQKKSRLIHTTLDPDRTVMPSPWPITVHTDVGLDLVNHANVFSLNQLDIGTRAMLDHLPPVADGSSVIDLGCGNGALGVALARTAENLSIHYVDLSHMAVASARATVAANLHDEGTRSTFSVADSLDHVENASVDLVLNNPPFHDDHVVGDDAALAMFVDAHRVLRPGGELRVVANRHLGHHAKLERVFGNHATVGSTKKFVVLSAIKAAIKTG